MEEQVPDSDPECFPQPQEVFAAERMPKMDPRGQDNLGEPEPDPRNDHDYYYDDQCGDCGNGNIRGGTQERRRHRDRLGRWQCPHSELSEEGIGGRPGRCILFLHCNCHLVAVAGGQSWPELAEIIEIILNGHLGSAHAALPCLVSPDNGPFRA